MGFLTVNGVLMTFKEYEALVGQYKAQGIFQFIKLFETHKDKHIAVKDLHWGEEIEYSLYSFKQAERSVKLSCDANDIM
jgi:hypothetical protein